MNILETNFHLDWGGQPSVVLLLAHKMRAAGHELTVAAPPGSALCQRARADGLEVLDRARFRRGFRPLSFLRDARTIGRCLHERAIDIIHVHGSQDSWIASLANRWFYGRARVVKTKHNTLPVRTHFANRWLYRSLCHHCTVVAESIRPLLEPLLPPEKITVIHAPLEDRFWQEEPPALDLRAELGLPADTLLVGNVARLSLMKGQDFILEAAPQILKALPLARILLVGTGEDYHRLLNRIQDLGLAEKVRLLGFRDDIAALLDNLDVALLASVWGEGSPVALKEAMARRLPVVATTLAGMAEIVEDGKNGLLIPPKDPAALAAAVVRLLTDRELARRLGQAGRETVLSRFTAEAIASQFLDLFARLTASPGP